MPDDKLRQSIIDLTEEYGWPEFVYESRRAYDERPKRGPGRPRELSKDRIMHVWIAIEIERYRRKLKGIDATVKAIFAEIHTYVEDTRGKKLKRWPVFVSDRDEREFPTSVRRYHTEAKQLMDADPKLAVRWRRNLETAKKIIDEKWRVTPTDRGFRIERGP